MRPIYHLNFNEAFQKIAETMKRIAPHMDEHDENDLKLAIADALNVWPAEILGDIGAEPGILVGVATAEPIAA